MESLLSRFREVIARHTGLVVPSLESRLLERTLTQRQRQLRLPGPEAYLALLEAEAEESAAEWRLLARELTTGESYFFRDHGQFTLLEEVLLPRLLAARRERRALRIWSAGCSTGEEPYSLAILLSRILPPLERWQLLLLGSDINEQALERARAGRYGQWSFRRLDDTLRERHFRREGAEWVLDPEIRERVVFRHINLIKDPFPSQELREMDLILCRNVFIYFSPETVAKLVAKFADTLAPGGILLTGHAELSQRPPPALVSEMYPQSVAYRRRYPHEALPPAGGLRRRLLPPDGAVPSAAGMVTSATRPPGEGGVPAGGFPRRPGTAEGGTVRPVRFGGVLRAARVAGGGRRRLLRVREETPPPDPLEGARKNFHKGFYQEARGQAEAVLAAFSRQDHPDAYEALYLLARIWANLGQEQRAVAYCRQAMGCRPLAAGPYHLLAQLSHEGGHPEEARAHLNRVLYLDPHHLAAHLELAELERERGDAGRAVRLRRAALDILRGLPAERRVEHYEAWTVAELMAHLNALLEEAGG